MVEELVNDYSAYLKLDVASGFQPVQGVIDNMLTRLEELTSVLQIVKMKNSDCNKTVSEDIIKHRSEVTTLSKKIITLEEVVFKLQNHLDVLEKQVEKAESDFGLNNDSKIKNFLKPFLMRNREANTTISTIVPVSAPHFNSVMDNFDTQ